MRDDASDVIFDEGDDNAGEKPATVRRRKVSTRRRAADADTESSSEGAPSQPTPEPTAPEEAPVRRPRGRPRTRPVAVEAEPEAPRSEPEAREVSAAREERPAREERVDRKERDSEERRPERTDDSKPMDFFSTDSLFDERDGSRGDRESSRDASRESGRGGERDDYRDDRGYAPRRDRDGEQPRGEFSGEERPAADRDYPRRDDRGGYYRDDRGGYNGGRGRYNNRGPGGGGGGGGRYGNRRGGYRDDRGGYPNQGGGYSNQYDNRGRDDRFRDDRPRDDRPRDDRPRDDRPRDDRPRDDRPQDDRARDDVRVRDDNRPRDDYWNRNDDHRTRDDGRGRGRGGYRGRGGNDRYRSQDDFRGREDARGRDDDRPRDQLRDDDRFREDDRARDDRDGETRSREPDAVRNFDEAGGEGREDRSRDDRSRDDLPRQEIQTEDGAREFDGLMPGAADSEFDRPRRGRGRPRRGRNPLEARNYRSDEREDRFEQTDVESNRFDSEVQEARDLQLDEDPLDPEFEGDGDFYEDDGSGRPRRRRRRRRRRGPGDGYPNDNYGPGPGPGPGGPRGRREPGLGRGRGPGPGRGPRGPRDMDRGGDFERDPRGLRRRTRNVAPATEIVEGIIDGVLELHPKGYGFLRDPRKNYMAQESDPFVPSSFIEKNMLREGVLLRAEVGSGIRNQGPRLKEIILVDGRSLEEWQKFKAFDELTAITPHRQIDLERGMKPITMRVMDLVTPIGMGQRALIVAPPRTGKTMLLQDIADSVSTNHPEIHLMVLLIDERPEEVTEMRRRVHGEVIASSMDREVESHVRISQLIIERGKRMAEMGKDVFILMDSITRMARAFNKWSSGSYESRTMSGGLSVKALDIPKKLFGTARQFDEGGSLTIVATALIDTGSKMDEVIFQEFKGTGNMELVLSRELADRRIWPAIDITRSGTRHEEKLYPPESLDSITMLRRSLISLSPVEAMEHLTKTLDKFPTNHEFLSRVKSLL